jgi:short-subunit dehydrogenase
MAESPVILITGASSGIGSATARLFAEQGYRTVLAARRLDRLQSLVGEIEAQGGSALAVQTDMGRLVDIQSLVRTVLDHYKQIDILFNNAGFGRLDWLEELDPLVDVSEQIQVNLLGLIWLSQAVIPHMVARRSGHVINMASMAGLVATPTYTVYAASKFGVRGFSEALRREVRMFGVNVSTICPGGVATEFAHIAGIHRKTNITTPSFMTLRDQDIAHAIWRLARRPRRLVIVPWVLHLAVWANAILPGFVDAAIERLFVKHERPI